MKKNADVMPEEEATEMERGEGSQEGEALSNKTYIFLKELTWTITKGVLAGLVLFSLITGLLWFLIFVVFRVG